MTVIRIRNGSWLLSSLLCFVLGSISSVATAQRSTLDRIIAVVDEDVVLQSELDLRLEEVRQQARLGNTPLPPEAELRRQVLDALVLENLQMQLAQRVSIRFDDDTLNRVMTNMAQQNNMSFDDFVAALESNGTYRSTREQVRKELTLRDLQRGMVNRRISITNQEIENFLNSEMGRSAMAPEYLVEHLLIPIAEDEPAAQILAKQQYAAELVARIEEGAELASIRAEAMRGGRFQVTGTPFGLRRLEQIPSLFTAIVPGMTINDVAGPIRAGNGFHIIQLMDIQGGTNRLVNQTHIRHIMVPPNEIRTDEQALALVTELRERIIGGEEFATLARQNSEDASSVVAGGDLDWVSEGGMPIEMEAVVNVLEVGEISEPFRTEGGWHIAEVLGRREEDLSREYGRNQAENALRNRKFDLELQNWLIEIREQAFVEYKD
ncbi:MAG: peptidylprolyl isomerase [Pseudohongiellaceae bacterium]